MNKKQVFEIQREAYQSIATVLSVALEKAEREANVVFHECMCGKNKHSTDAKYCCNCGMELKVLRCE